MMDKVYSHNEEDWVEELQEAIDAAIEQQDCQPEEINIKIGDKKQVAHSDLSSGIGGNVIDQLREWAYEDASDWSDGYLESVDDEGMEKLTSVITKWLDANAKQPNYYKVDNIKDFECAADIALSFNE